ncbi:MAG: YbaK/EbsC family protein [Gammaproteobacteria bacterium]|nr:YbaK/EbsC family protein [Gammaproteobacteria bacterium]MDH3507451.1 YbaK/EbsC family protein [Gammaproteobacteria bacterium]
MSVAATVGDALEFEGVEFRVVRKLPAGATEGCAKARLLKDAHGFVLTVTAVGRDLDIGLLRRELHRELIPAGDDDLDELFCDCEAGSVPPIGPWYRVPTIVDSSLRDQTDIFFDAGMSRSLVQVTEPSFEKLLEGAEYFAFSR